MQRKHIEIQQYNIETELVVSSKYAKNKRADGMFKSSKIIQLWYSLTPFILALMVILTVNSVMVEHVNAKDQITHVVRRGDTLFAISRQYNITVQQIRIWNDLTGDEIELGQILLVSAPEGSSIQEQAPPSRPQAPQQAASERDKSLVKSTIESTRLEREYDRFITENIAQYFNPSTFFVNTRLKIVLVELEFSEKTVDEAGIRTLEQTLPGLVGIPDFLRDLDQQPATQNERTVTQMVPDIQQISIEIAIDERYTPEQSAFIEYLARSSSKLDRERGDTLRLIPMPFPGPLQSLMDSPFTQNRMDEMEEQPVADTAGLFNELTALHYALLTLAALLLLLIIIAIILLMRRNRETGKKGVQQNTTNRGGQASLPLIEAIENKATEREISSKERIKEKVFAGRMDDDCSLAQILLNYFMNYPNDMSRMLDEWIIRDGENGLHNAVMLLLSADYRMTEKLLPVMNANNARLLVQRINEEVESGKMIDTKILLSTAKERINELRSREMPNTLGFRLRTLRHFDFLEFVNIDFLAEILKNEQPYISALTLSHLSTDRAERLMEKLPEEQLPAIWSEVQLVNKINYTNYTAYANNILQSLIEYENRAFVNNENDYSMVDYMCSQIEKKDTQTQNRLFTLFSKDESAVSKEVVDRLVTIANLDKVDPEIIKKASDTLEPEKIGLALVGLESWIIKLTLENRGVREKQLIQSILENYKDFSEKEIESAKQDFLNLIRDYKRVNVEHANR